MIAMSWGLFVPVLVLAGIGAAMVIASTLDGIEAALRGRGDR